MRRHVLMVMPRFVPQVKAGTKIHTVRLERKRRIEPGDVLDLRQWEGKPYRSKQIKVVEKVCTGTQPVRISWLRLFVGTAYRLVLLNTEEMAEFSRNDGFHNFDHLITFFLATHSLPFDGNVIHWGNPSYLA